MEGANATNVTWAEPGTMEELVDWTHVICAPFTVLFNTAVLLIAGKYVDVRGRLNQWYVISLTTADLLYGLVYLATKRVMIYFPRSVCQIYYCLSWTSQIMSLFSLLLLNFDKFISLQYPLHYHQIVTERSVTYFLVAFWGFASIYSVVTFTSSLAIFAPYATRIHGRMFTSNCRCDLNPIHYTVTLIVLYVLPTLISLSISFYIFSIAQNLGKRLPGIPESRIEKNNVRKRLIKRILFVFSSTMWTGLTFLPYRMFISCYYVSKFIQPKQQAAPWISTLGHSLWMLLPLGSVVNPLITIATQRIYRVGVKRTIRLVLIKLKIPPSWCGSLLSSGLDREWSWRDEDESGSQLTNLQLIAPSVRTSMLARNTSKVDSV